MVQKRRKIFIGATLMKIFERHCILRTCRENRVFDVICIIM